MSITNQDAKTFSIVGCGRIGITLGYQLIRRGWALTGITDKSPEALSRASAILGTKKAFKKPEDATSGADIIFITTPDNAIAPTCAGLVKNKAISKDSILFHCSGAHPSTLLSEAQKAGISTGSFHPVQSFASPQVAFNPFKNIVITVEGCSGAVAQGHGIATSLGAKCFEIDTNSKTLYHAAAVVASNYFVALMDTAGKLLTSAGIPKENAWDVLSPLVDGTLKNINSLGVGPALTGPIARGDKETVQRHLSAISEQAPDLKSIYQNLGAQATKIASDQSFITSEEYDSFMDAFKD